MTLKVPGRIPGAAKALIVLTAAGLLLGGCHVGARAYHGGPHFAKPHYGYGQSYGKHYRGKHWKHGGRHDHRRGGRGHR